MKSHRKKELIIECFRFFANTYVSEGNGWQIIPQEANNYPRANWWNYSGISSKWGNPNAEILGYLYEYPDLRTKDMNHIKQHLTSYAKNYLQKDCDLTEMHELFCFVRLAEKISEDLRNLLFKNLIV